MAKLTSPITLAPRGVPSRWMAYASPVFALALTLLFGALLFGAADKLDSVLRRAGGETRVVILHLAAVTAMDATALNALETLHEKLKRHGRHLILSGPHTQPYFMMEKAGFLDAVGADNIAADLPAAVARARTLLRKN